MPFPHLSAQYELLKIIFKFADRKKIKLYLVGGLLRDLLLAREKTNLDIDFALEKGAIAFAKALSRPLKAACVVLDKEHGCCRLVKRFKDKVYTFDFTDFRGKTLTDDLHHRDFTINALALGLKEVFLSKKGVPEKKALANLLIDPHNGIKDLRGEIIRAVNKKSFQEDPLRILRAFSLAALFHFKIEPATLKLIKLEKNKLKRISVERIRDELFKIFNQPDSLRYLAELDKLGILKLIIPELELMRALKQGPYHHLDVFRHSLETLRQLEGLIQELSKQRDIQKYLKQVISGERRRFTLMKLAAILHDIGKPQALRKEGKKIKFYGHEKIGLDISREIAQRLKLSNDEIDALARMVLWHLRPGYLSDIAELTERAKFRYFRDTGKEAVSILLLAIADQRATQGPLTVKKDRVYHEKLAHSLIKEYFRREKAKPMPRLVNGNDLLRKFKLAPSPLIGKILREIEELQAVGEVKTKQAALVAAKKFL